MFENLKKISALLLALVVVFTTSGFNIYSHDCDCCNTSELSLINTDTCCETEKTDSPCENNDEQNVSPCCETKPTSSEAKQSCTTADCCQVESSFIKLDYLFGKTTNLQIKQIQIHKPKAQLMRTESKAFVFVKKLILLSDNSPPKISDQDIVIFGNTLKIHI